LIDWLSNIFFGWFGDIEKYITFQLVNNLLCKYCTKNDKNNNNNNNNN